MSAETNKMNEHRLYELDGLRGIACIMVLVFHYTKYMHAHYDFEWQFLYGVTGVDLFFIISGFVIYMTLINTSSLGAFFISRFTRLYPVFWFVVLLTSLFCFAFNVNEITLKNILANLTMMPALLGSKYIDNSYWTLLVELQFYFVIAFFFFFFRKISTFNKSYILLFLLLIVHAISIYLDQGKKIIYYMPILAFWNLFLTGMLFYKFRNEKKTTDIFTWLIIIINIIFVYYTHKQAGMSQYYLSACEHTIIDAFYFLLFYLLVNNKLTFLKNKVLVFLGAISYSIYLIHQTIGYILLDFFQGKFNNNLLSLITTTIIILILSYGTNLFIEKPLMIKFRIILDKIFNKQKSVQI